MNRAALAAFHLKFRRFNWEERRALGEALLLLALGAVAVRLMPLEWLGRIAEAGPFGRPPRDPNRAEVLTWMVGWAVERAARRSPLRAKCFEQGLAAQVMLRRRGIDSTLFYGVGFAPCIERPVRAHVWVETERFPVVGRPEPGDFALLATWPKGRPAIWAECLS